MDWKNINGTPYKVSEYGDVIRTEVGTNGKGMKPLVHRMLKSGYHRVQLCYDGVQIDKYVHRLVAEVFITNPRSFPEVNHKDSSKDNNHYSNLVWVSHKWNMQHAAMNHKLNPDRKLDEEAVKAIKWYLKNRPDISHQQLADLHKVSRGTITDINIGRSWRYVTI